MTARTRPLPDALAAAALLTALAHVEHAHAQRAPWAPAAPEGESGTGEETPAAPPEPLRETPPPPGFPEGADRAGGPTVPPPATETPGAPPASESLEPYGTTPNPAFTHHFQMPTARPLRQGDMMVTVGGYLGWAGLRYGITPRLDAGVGLPIYGAGVSVDARYALVLGDSAAVSLWAYASVPILPGDASRPSDFFGFTWQGGGAAWIFGPVVSVWGERVGLHVGVHAAQRVLLGGAWAFLHATLEGRVSDSFRAILQGVLLAEVVSESAGNARGRELLGGGSPRVFPYVIAGIRLHSRKFSVDVGALAVLASGAPLGGGGVTFWPWTSVSQVF